MKDTAWVGRYDIQSPPWGIDMEGWGEDTT